MANCRSTPASRRYAVRVAVAMVAYLVSLALAVRFLENGPSVKAWGYLLAIAPGVSVAGLFWAFGRLLIEEKDEYQRMLLVRQSLAATGFTLSIITVWGFLDNFGMVPPVSALYVALLWFIGLGVGSFFNWLAASRHENT